MILDEDLTDFEKAGKLCYVPVVQNPDENWHLAQGLITSAMIQHFMPQDFEQDIMKQDSIVMTCGPPMLKDSIQALTTEMGWTNTFMFN